MTKTRDLADLGGGFIQAGTGAQQRTVESKLQDTVSVKDFGAVGDGVTDDTAAIQAALTACEGRTLIAPKGVYIISSTLNITKSGVNLVGESLAQGVFGDTTELGSVFKWTGGASPMITVLVGGGLQASKSGGAIKRLKLDGAGVATQCLKTESAEAWRFEDLKLTGAVTAAWEITGKEPYSTGFNDFYQCVASNISIVVTGSAHGIYSGVTTVTGSESTGEHPAFCDFTCVHITYSDGIGLYVLEADDCTFTNLGISRSAGGTGDAIVLENSGTHGNHFRCVNVTNADGTPPRIWATGGSKSNYMELAGIDKNIKPTVDPGSELYYIYLGSNVVANQAEASLPPVKFPNVSTGVGLNYLNHFEQGDWTPGISFGNADTDITYAARLGRFQRVGLTVHATASIVLSSKGTATGTARVTGLPYAAGSTNVEVGTWMPRTGFAAITAGGTYLELSTSSVNAILRVYNGGSGVVALDDTNFTNTSSLILHITYQLY